MNAASIDAAAGQAQQAPPAATPEAPRPAPKQVVSALLAAMEGISGRGAAVEDTFGCGAAPPERPQDSPEQELRLLARLSEENPGVVLRLDSTGTLLYANPAGRAFVAACGGAPGERLPAPWPDHVREAYEFGMVRGEEVEIGGACFDVTFVPVPEAGCVNLYAVDISRRRHAEDAAREGARKLMRSLEQTIEMLARAVEKRDPATYGHQHRVARIAVAIATDMGLEPDRIEGLRLGASIHDIGKIHTPAELLSRPGKLRAAEIELIRRHPVTGYEIVKDVEFPWPVAQMVLQHHERLDGSGYPQGLQGEDILLEARILAVADVVEGISAHRPYRPAMGLDAALREIERMRGRWLDAQAVDSCLRVFREQEFVLPA
jgi:putative nucleotidyltransferase with HDIG domain